MIKYIITSAGRVVPNENNNDFDYQYYINDHLGNTRIMFNSQGILQTNSYYPFGMLMEGFGDYVSTSNPNKYLYNGKEFQDDFDLDWYDYGARMYDAQIGRWHVVDPLAEMAFRWSPYRYGFNNPIRYFDPNGLREFDVGEVKDYFEMELISKGGEKNNRKRKSDDDDPQQVKRVWLQEVEIIAKRKARDQRSSSRLYIVVSGDAGVENDSRSDDGTTVNGDLLFANFGPSNVRSWIILMLSQLLYDWDDQPESTNNTPKETSDEKILKEHGGIVQETQARPSQSDRDTTVPYKHTTYFTNPGNWTPYSSTLTKDSTIKISNLPKTDLNTTSYEKYKR